MNQLHLPKIRLHIKRLNETTVYLFNKKVQMKYLLHIILILGLMSCNLTKSGPGVDLYDEVMLVHDEVMPLLGPMKKLRKNIQKRTEKDDIDLEDKNELIQSMADLKKGEDAMWDWMHNFDKPSDINSESSMEYLKKEKEKINEVSILMKKVHADASNVLSRLK